MQHNKNIKTKRAGLGELLYMAKEVESISGDLGLDMASLLAGSVCEEINDQIKREINVVEG